MQIKANAAFLIFCGAAFGQVELVQNNWPTDPQGYKFYPDADVTYASRVFNNAGVGIPSQPYRATVKQYAGLGFHSHETANGCCAITRPPVAFLSGETGFTDSNGYMNTSVEFNGYAGWYTFCHQVLSTTGAILSEKCVNNNTRYSTSTLGYQIWLERYSGGLTPGANDTNQPQTLHWDRRHVCANQVIPGAYCPPTTLNSDGYTNRWVTHDVHLRLLGMSSYYRSLTSEQGIFDLADITRASLPDGGVYDNDVAGVAPGNGLPANANTTSADWNTRVFEEHSRGVEADIVVPVGAARQDALFDAITTAGCYIGLFTPEGVKISNAVSQSIQITETENYWRQQGDLHASCKPGQSLRSGGRRAM